MTIGKSLSPQRLESSCRFRKLSRAELCQRKIVSNETRLRVPVLGELEVFFRCQKLVMTGQQEAALKLRLRVFGRYKLQYSYRRVGRFGFKQRFSIIVYKLMLLSQENGSFLKMLDCLREFLLAESDLS